MSFVSTYWAGVLQSGFSNTVPNFSIDGTVTWNSAGLPPGVSWPNDPHRVWGPRNAWKFYFLCREEGVWYYDDTGWHLEYQAAGVLNGSTYQQSIWCNEDDTYVAAYNGGAYLLDPSPTVEGVERVGPPGTAWTPIPGNPGFAGIHGTPDGSSIFAVGKWPTPVPSIARLDSLEIWKRDSGVWGLLDSWGSAGDNILPVPNRSPIFVVSDTEVWIFGKYVVAPLKPAPTIWKWNGTSLDIAFSKEYFGTVGTYEITAFHMAEDGSEGWAIIRAGATGNTDIVYYNGTSWSIVQSENYSGAPVSGVTQFDGEPTSGKFMLGDTSIREYDGASWDDTYAGTPDFTGATYSAIYFQLFAKVSSPPYLDNLDPAESETGVYPDEDIVLEVLDDDGDLNTTSVVIEVNGVVAWSGGAEQNGFSVTTTTVSLGVRYTITPPSPLEYGTNEVEVYAEDLS